MIEDSLDLEQKKWSLIVIGASAGGVEGLKIIFSNLKSTLKSAMIIVLHQPSHSNQLAAQVYKSWTPLPVSEAEEKQSILPGHIYFAPPGYHLLIESDKTFSLSTEAPVNFSRPSIDVLFESAADVYKEDVLGVILSGANADGAQGLYEVVKYGGRAMIQNPQTALFSAMPLAAKIRVPNARTMELVDLAEFLGGL
jgi:two-component system chemotaxis response regulator CheB